MRICSAFLLSSPTIAPILHLVHVEALLLLPRNQAVRRRLKTLVAAWSLVHFNHSDPYSEDEDADSAERHPNVIAARRPIAAVEAMLTDGRYRTVLTNYRRACSRGEEGEMERIEQIIAAILELQPASPAAE
jgi:hypothetical protein